MPGESVLAAMVGHVLTGLLAHLLFEDAEAPKTLKRIGQAVAKSPDVSEILQNATALTARFAPLHKGYPERVRSFLVSPEVESIVRQIFSTELAKKGESHVPELRAEFQRLLALHLSDSERVSVELSGQLFDVLIATCQRAINAAVNSGSLPALALKMTSDHRLILDEIAGVRANLSFLSKATHLDVGEIDQFEQKFRKQIGNANKHITPPNLEGSKKVPIEKLFVPSNFIYVANKEKIQEVPLPAFLPAVYRAVILGNPGGGKSTFARKLCHDLAIHHSERLVAGRELTPILVTLRDYGSEKKSHGVSILQFIERTSNSDYQVTPPAGAFEYLLLNGRALVIFDGLDELLDTSDRQKITTDVELFAELYPSVPIIVTSREVGYEQAPLDEEQFEIFRLAPFSTPQIETYVHKWFATSSDLTPTEQKKKATSFLAESRIVPDLTSNPLMLALMCTIYRGEGTIPRNRPDVYGKCAEMLFEKWDKRRGIQVSLPIEAHVRPAMNHLASWIYSDEALQRGVPQSSLVEETKKYLLQWCFDDPVEAQSAAAQFIEFCSGRAWVFTDTGTKGGGERLYQFTHRTFLEYFTAVNLVQTHRTPEELADVLHPHIAKREWDIVAQLAFQVKAKGFRGDSDLLINGLLVKSKALDPKAGWNLLDFAARCLAFIVPTPSVRRAVTDACVDACIHRSQEILSTESSPEEDQRDRERLIVALLFSAQENRATVVDAMKLYVTRTEESGDHQRTLLALEMALHATLPIHTAEARAAEELTNFWGAFSKDIGRTQAGRLREVSRSDQGIAIDCVWARIITMEELVNWHGISAILQRRPLRIFNAIRVPILAWTIRSVFVPFMRSDTLEREMSFAEDIGRILLSRPQPWFPPLRDRFDAGIVQDGDFGAIHEKPQEPASVSADALFGSLVVVALFSQTKEGMERLRVHFDRITNPIFLKLRPLLSHLILSAEPKYKDSEATRLGFSKEQKALLKSWSGVGVPSLLCERPPDTGLSKAEDRPMTKVDPKSVF